MDILEMFNLHDRLSQSLNKGKKMPTYEYKCGKCNKVIPILHPMKEVGKDRFCPDCKGKLTRMFSVPHIRQNPGEFKKIQKHKRLMRKHYRE